MSAPVPRRSFGMVENGTYIAYSAQLTSPAANKYNMLWAVGAIWVDGQSSTTGSVAATTGQQTTGQATTGKVTTGLVIAQTTGKVTTAPATTGQQTTGQATTGQQLAATTGKSTTGKATTGKQQAATTGKISAATTGQQSAATTGTTGQQAGNSFFPIYFSFPTSYLTFHTLSLLSYCSLLIRLTLDIQAPREM